MGLIGLRRGRPVMMGGWMMGQWVDGAAEWGRAVGRWRHEIGETGIGGIGLGDEENGHGKDLQKNMLT